MIHRVFQATALAVGIEIDLDQDAVNHVANVLRLKVNEPLIIFNSKGGEYLAKIIEIKRRKVKVRLNEFKNINRESNLRIHLAQGLVSGDKMDFILQKFVELGGIEITPIITARCNVKLSSDRWQKKITRWQKIIISACEQCGRNILPKINLPVSFADFVSQNKANTKIILDPNGSLSCRDLIAASSICVLIGSEGGFTDEEVALAKEHNFLDVEVGSRILRAETAGIAIISILQSQYGDF
ncbi:MAG: 16S rRNA (uracil(1498)-N(3))-methyltransferase [Gammaproteobacteria bacterium]|jgi:16S rRNA (uracil1498-N3)-methyltransferase